MKRVRQSVTRELSVPEEVVGYVIGRHGARVRQIEEETGAQIRFKDVQASRNKVSRLLCEPAHPFIACVLLCVVNRWRWFAVRKRQLRQRRRC